MDIMYRPDHQCIHCGERSKVRLPHAPSACPKFLSDRSLEQSRKASRESRALAESIRAENASARTESIRRLDAARADERNRDEATRLRHEQQAKHSAKAQLLADLKLARQDAASVALHGYRIDLQQAIQTSHVSPLESIPLIFILEHEIRRDAFDPSDFDPAQRSDFTAFIQQFQELRDRVNACAGRDGTSIGEWIQLIAQRLRLLTLIPETMREDATDALNAVDESITNIRELKSTIEADPSSAEYNAKPLKSRANRSESQVDECLSMDPDTARSILVEGGQPAGRLSKINVDYSDPSAWSRRIVRKWLTLISVVTTTGGMAWLSTVGGGAAPVVTLIAGVACLSFVFMYYLVDHVFANRTSRMMSIVCMSVGAYEALREQLLQVASHVIATTQELRASSLTQCSDVLSQLVQLRAALHEFVAFEGDAERGGRIQSYSGWLPALEKSVLAAACLDLDAQETFPIPQTDVGVARRLEESILRRRRGELIRLEPNAALLEARIDAVARCEQFARELSDSRTVRTRSLRVALGISIWPAVAWSIAAFMNAEPLDAWTFVNPRCWVNHSSLSESELRRDCAHGHGLACGILGANLLDPSPGRATDAARVLSAGCDLGSVLSCTHLARILLNGWGGVDKSPRRAFELFQRGCENGDSLACNGAGIATADIDGDSAQAQAQAVRFFRRACDAGEMRGCANLAASYERGAGVRTSSFEARRLYEFACQRDPKVGCEAAGRARAAGLGQSPDPVGAVQLFRRGCSAGDGAACLAAGRALTLGLGVTANILEAIALMIRACERGAPLGCYYAGVAELDGSLGTVSRERGLSHLNRACRNGTADACVRWSAFVLFEDPAPSDDDLVAIQLLERTCDWNNALACMALAKCTAEGIGVTPDPDRAIGLFRKSCDLGEGQACFALGGFFQRGVGVDRNPREATRLLQRACDRGITAACSR